VLPFRHKFRQSVEDTGTPLSFDLESDSRTLLIAFGGMAGQIGMPPFEFFKATGEIRVKRLFVRDLHQAWYHRGIPGHGATLQEAAASLGELIASHGVQRLVVAGNSAGGYAALSFGTLLGAHTVLCFAPQTTLELAALADMGDHRWDQELRELADAEALDPGWTDLRRALPQARRSDTRLEVFYDAALEVDRLQAERLEGLEGLALNRINGGEHSVARKMRESGELGHVLRGALLADPS
jgi:pimeloyl-ACP methyl ester carboxylesterase